MAHYNPALADRNRQIAQYYQDHTLKQTGAAFSISHERVRQILLSMDVPIRAHGKHINYRPGPGSVVRTKDVL